MSRLYLTTWCLYYVVVFQLHFAVGFSELPDVTTIYRPEKPSEVSCFARTNAVGFPFRAPNGSTVDPKSESNIPSCHIEQNGPCPWEPLDWDVIASGDNYRLPPFAKPVELNLTTTGAGLSQLVPLSHPFFHFRVRTSRLGLARLLLIQDRDVRTSDLYMVDVVHQHQPSSNETSMVLRCGQGPQYQQRFIVIPGEPARTCKNIGNFHLNWVKDQDLVFRVEFADGYLALWREDYSTALLERVKINDFNANFLAVASHDMKLNWTIILEAKALLLKESGGWIRSPPFTHNSPFLCLSFFAFLEGGHGCGLEVTARINNDTHRVMGSARSSKTNMPSQWKLLRLNMNLTDKIGSQVEIIIQGFKEDPFATVAVQDIMGCTMTGNTTAAREEMVIMQLPQSMSEKPFICDILASPSSKKTRQCGVCANGGVCDRKTNICACAPGFVGEYCEEGCGHNRYGSDCEGQCTGSIDGCRGLMMCSALVGCHCASGFYGTNCSKVCNIGFYGGDCHFKCGSCKDGEACDVYSGECSSGCQMGYYAPYCRETYTYLLDAPSVTNISFNDVVVHFTANQETIGGVGDPKFFQVEYLVLDDDDKQWHVEPAVLLSSNTSGHVEHFLSGLHAGKPHMLRVLLIDRDGKHYANESALKMENFTTPCTIPEFPIYELETTNIYKDSFEIKWKYEVNSTKACDMIYFNVYLKDGWTKNSNLHSNTKNHTLLIENRSPNSMHWVQIQAVTQFGFAPKSKPLMVTTLEGVPSVVLELDFNEVSPTELFISWKPPRYKNGVIKYYSIKYKCLKYLACENYNCSHILSNLTSEDTTIILSNLVPHTQYEVLVAAYTIELGPFSSITAVTRFSEPSAAPIPSSKPVLRRTTSSLTFTWLPVKDCRNLNGFAIGYKYNLYRISGEGPVLESSGTITRPPVTFIHLLSYQDYDVYVWQLVTGGLLNPEYKLVISATTRAILAPAVRHFEAINITANSAVMKWERPFVISENAIHYYTLTYQCMHLMACPIREECSSPITITTKETQVLLSNLEPYAVYTVTMSIFTGEMGVPTTISVVTSATAPEAVPQPAAQTVLARGRTWAVVQWRPPEDCRQLHGPLLGYEQRVLSHGDVIMTRRSNLSILTTNFTHLSPYNEYQVEVYVVTGNDDKMADQTSSHSLSLAITTKPPAPNEVIGLDVFRRSVDHLGLRFQLPVYRFGILDSATLNYRNNRGDSGQVIVPTNPCVIWPLFVCVNLTGLQPNTTYTVFVSVWNNKTKEEGMLANVTAVTREEAPGPPSFVHSLNRTNSDFYMEVGIPNMLNGILRGFRIEKEQFTSFNPVLCCQKRSSKEIQVNEEKASYIIQVQDLYSSSSYVITVSAVTIVPGPVLSLKHDTLPTVPVIETSPLAVAKSVTSTSAVLKIWAPINYRDGPISAFFVVVKTPQRRLSVGKFNSKDLQNQILELVGPKAYVAMELQEAEVGKTRSVMIGNGEEYLGAHGVFVNTHLNPATTYTVEVLVMSAYKESYVFGRAVSAPFTTDI